MSTVRHALKTYWGAEDFRPGQEEVIQAVLQGKDVLAVLPTGGGKSLCYQLPALLLEGITLVVSPLIALMEDQVAGLRSRGISAAFLHSGLSLGAIEQCLVDATYGKYKLLYVAPERLQSEGFRKRLARLNIALLAVDEAHCISEWGHQFRPAYREIASVWDAFQRPPTLALTATATPEVRRDIVEQLQLRQPTIVVRGFDRPNIVWSAFYTENKKEQLKRIVENVSGSGIVYVATRKHAEYWGGWLRREGIPTGIYHAGLSPDERRKAYIRWMQGKERLMVATSAFGMGIDKPDVRLIVHLDIPVSLEAYYQEAGRAGRGGKRSYAVLIHGPGDREIPTALIKESIPTPAEIQTVYRLIGSQGQVSIGELPEAWVAVDVPWVAKQAKCSVAKVRKVIELLQRQGIWSVVPERKGWGYFRFRMSAQALRQYVERLAKEHPALAQFIQNLLRSVPAEAFHERVPVLLKRLADRMNFPVDRLKKGLFFLQEREIIEWVSLEEQLFLEFLVPRMAKVPVDAHVLKKVQRIAQWKLKMMFRYTALGTCRRQFLLAYFGEKMASRCGACDVCMGRHAVSFLTAADEPLLVQLMENIEAGLMPEQWLGGQAPYPHRLEGLIQWLIQAGYLSVIDPFQGQFALTEVGKAKLEQMKATKT